MNPTQMDENKNELWLTRRGEEGGGPAGGRGGPGPAR